MQILETPRLILRKFQPDDVDALVLTLSDVETMRFYPAPFDRTAVEDWIFHNLVRYQEDGHGLWAMILNPVANSSATVASQFSRSMA